MKRLLVCILLVVGVTALPVTPNGSRTAVAAGARQTVLGLEVTGTGVGMYPAYQPSVDRYAVTTTDRTAGTVTVTATTSDSSGTVRIDGRPAPGGSRTLTGLSAGDEIAVFVTDSSGVHRTSLIYLPAGFPTLARATTAPGVGQPSPGLVLLTLGLWTKPSSFYETAVDANGVPAYVFETPNSMDFKRLSNGHYTVARRTEVPGRTGSDIVELDDQFREVARHRTVGLTDTDGHDSIVAPDGSTYLLSSETNPATGLVDAIVQQVDAQGRVVFQWNSKDHVDIPAETVIAAGDPDYAHVNSVQVMDDGDLLVSFRHLSSVFKIARTAHDGFRVGDVVWKLGGRDSDFTFSDASGHPDGGPCAQHTAYQLSNGHILTFDNGAWSVAKLCIDPADPLGPLVARVPTRIAEWSLDPATHVATLVWNYEDRDRYAIFAGSAQRLPSGNTLIGWAASTVAVASEVDPAGRLVWDLEAVGDDKYFTYRAMKADVPDTQRPQVVVTTPAGGAAYVEGRTVTPVVDCTDRGGSGLVACDVPSLATDVPGRHRWTAVATDGAGNITTVTRSYTVRALHRPDARIRTRGSAAWSRTASAVVRTAAPRAVATVRVTNEGARRDRFALRVTRGSSAFRLTRVAHRTPVLRPGQAWTVRLPVTRTKAAKAGSQRVFRVRVASAADPTRTAVVSFRVRAGR